MSKENGALVILGELTMDEHLALIMKKFICLIFFSSLISCQYKFEQKAPRETTFSEFEVVCRGDYTITSVCSVLTSGSPNILDWNKGLICEPDISKSIGWVKYSELSEEDKFQVSHFYHVDNECTVNLELNECFIGGCYYESLARGNWSINKGMIILYIYDKKSQLLYRITNNDHY